MITQALEFWSDGQNMLLGCCCQSNRRCPRLRFSGSAGRLPGGRVFPVSPAGRRFWSCLDGGGIFAVAGALVGGLAGHCEIRGKLRYAIGGALAGSLIGLLAGVIFGVVASYDGKSYYPPKEGPARLAEGIFVCFPTGIVAGGLVGFALGVMRMRKRQCWLFS